MEYQAVKGICLVDRTVAHQERYTLPALSQTKVHAGPCMFRSGAIGFGVDVQEITESHGMGCETGLCEVQLLPLLCVAVDVGWC